VGEDRIAERQRVFKQYKEDVKDRGKPFFPFAMWHDTVMSFVVVLVIIGLAVVWKWSVPGDHTGTHSGLLGKLYDEPADPGTFNFVPRPDWYFYFLFYLLRVFKWPSSVILGTVGIPTILLLLLIAIPFIDTRAERNPLKRPVAMVASVLVILSMGILTYRGAVAKEALGPELLKQVPKWAQEQGFVGNKQAVAGAKLFASLGCLNCHTYLGSGNHNLGAPDLSNEGSKGRGVFFQIAHLKCPSCVNKGSPMPPFASQGNANLTKLAIFLEASKGPKK
jgi:ubiquinol-cytochrome c reductase cytochrome b subunit/menaquinol-cytochrome c reductase cytochrome b/c subunit